MIIDQPVYGVVYVVECSASGKSYVGQTTHTAEERWKTHVASAGSTFVLGKAILKYGAGTFTIRTLDTASDKRELNEKEIHWVKTLGTLSPAGYNLTEGGQGGRHSPETKAKQSARRKGVPLSDSHRKNAAKGVQARYDWEREMGITRSRTEAQLHILRTIAIGRKTSPETKAKQSAAARARLTSPEERQKAGNGKRGVKKSAESIAKRVATMRLKREARQTLFAITSLDGPKPT